jgi:hypothetical protein
VLEAPERIGTAWINKKDIHSRSPFDARLPDATARSCGGTNRKNGKISIRHAVSRSSRDSGGRRDSKHHLTVSRKHGQCGLSLPARSIKTGLKVSHACKAYAP